MTAYSAGLERKGVNKLSNLINWLLAQNRIEDIHAVTELDSEKADIARKRLFEEYNQAKKISNAS